MNEKRRTVIDRKRYDAVLFDLDGVITATAKLHAASWKTMFDGYLKERAAATGEEFRPFDAGEDYKRYVDGKLRGEGVRSFLESRGIELPWGDPADPPEAGTVCGLGNRKNRLVKEAIAAGGVEVYESTVTLAKNLLREGFRTAVVSASRNCLPVLEAAGIAGLFEARVDGVVAGEEGLAGKPAPDTFLRAAELLGAPPARSVVIEDALSGVEAGRAGAFGLVVGVDRKGDAAALNAAGAHVVVQDLAELTVAGEGGGP
jgi:alpha,alpha-trehalase